MDNHQLKNTLDDLSQKDFFICPECGAISKLNNRLFMAYFTSGNIHCEYCNKPIDLWKTFNDLLDPPMLSFAYHYSLLGCINKHTKLMIKPNELIRLDLSEEIGDGDLLYINYTSGPGWTFPIETHSNVPISHLKVKNKLLYGQPIEKNAKETEVNVSYWFAPKELKDDLSTMLLLDAFKFYFEENYRYMIISAHSSVEIILSKFIQKIFKEYGISKNKMDKFNDKFETEKQLDYILPFICNLLDFPLLNEKIVNGLNIIRNKRNELMHEGETKDMHKSEYKIMILSAFFAYKYFKIHMK